MSSRWMRVARRVRVGLAGGAGLLLLTLTTTECTRNDQASEAEHEVGHHAHGEDEHGHGHDPSSLGSVTMFPDALAANHVEIKRAGPGTVRTEIELPGEIILNADRVAHFVPRFPGIVLQVEKKLGDPVRDGDVMAVIQSNASAAPYEVKSMVDGTVIEKHITLGEFVRDDADIFVVADLSTVWINVSVYARVLADVKVGQRLRISASGVRETAEGSIDYVGPIVGESTRTGVARMTLPNRGRVWQPGMFVTAHITVSEAAVPVAVPDEAVQTVEGREVVFVRRMNEFTATPVVTGRRGGDLIEIVEGLEPGAYYVAAGSFIFKAEFGKSEAAHEH